MYVHKTASDKLIFVLRIPGLNVNVKLLTMLHLYIRLNLPGTHSFILSLFQIKQEALEEERKKKEKEEEEAKAQVCNQGLIIKSSF